MINLGTPFLNDCEKEISKLAPNHQTQTPAYRCALLEMVSQLLQSKPSNLSI